MEHSEALQKLCRLCGENINRYRVTYSCQACKDDLYKAFHLRVDDNSDDIHPPNFCDTCYGTMSRKVKAIEDNRPYMQSLKIFPWSEHSNPNCNTCTKYLTVKKGGRPKKTKEQR